MVTAHPTIFSSFRQMQVATEIFVWARTRASACS
jgi:hypothetical protein